MMGRHPVNAILSIRDLRHEFSLGSHTGKGRAVQVLRGVELELYPGECLALVGESGSGKTTMARALLGLISPSHGSILFKGEDVLGMSSEALQNFRRKVQIVFQDPFGSLNPRLRAEDMLLEVLKVHGRGGGTAESRRQRALELLEMVGLSPAALRRFPHEFSGGQRQRLGIARALAVEPELLVLDEPVSALDLSVQAQILNLLTELQGTLGLTYLFVTHDLSVVRHMAQRVAVLYLGRVVECGPAEALFRYPLHPYTRGLLAAVDPWRRERGDGSDPVAGSLLPGEPPDPLHPPTGCVLHPRCPHPSKDEACRATPPPLEGFGEGREVACWKAGKHPGNP